MSMIQKLPDILQSARLSYESLRTIPVKREFSTQEVLKGEDNQLIKGDNLAYMRCLLQKGMEGRIDLIYIDPPFFSKTNYSVDIKVERGKKKLSLSRHHAFSDRWDQGLEEYLEMMAVRLFFMRALLSETGSIFVHLDWHSSHYIKIIMDEIFGEDLFVNEIIWNYKSGGVSKRHFSRKHDTILFYAKTKHYYFQMQKEKSYNRQLKPYRFRGVKEYKDETGWYTLVGMKDVWQIDMVGRTAKERTGYATQKPEALIQRILLSATKEGDLCADFFCGSGTLGSAAGKMGRRFLLCDSGDAAVVKAHKRLAEQEIPHSLIYEKAMEKEDSLLQIQAECTLTRAHLAPGLRIRLTGLDYRNLEELGLEADSEKLLKTLLKKDFVQLVEYWCVDANYDGKCLHPAVSLCAGKEPVLREVLLPYVPQGEIAIKVMDVFGKEAVILCKAGEGKEKKAP